MRDYTQCFLPQPRNFGLPLLRTSSFRAATQHNLPSDLEVMEKDPASSLDSNE